MLFGKWVIVTLLFIERSAAALQFTNPSYSGIQVGSPFTLTWTGASGPVTLSLLSGPASDLSVVEVIASMSLCAIFS